MPDAFYEPDGDRYLATELTRGPWDPGPSTPGRRRRCSAGRSSGCRDAEEFQVGRVTFEILRSVPIGAGRGRGARRRAPAAACSWSRRS